MRSCSGWWLARAWSGRRGPILEELLLPTVEDVAGAPVSSQSSRSAPGPAGAGAEWRPSLGCVVFRMFHAFSPLSLTVDARSISLRRNKWAKPLQRYCVRAALGRFVATRLGKLSKTSDVICSISGCRIATLRNIPDVKLYSQKDRSSLLSRPMRVACAAAGTGRAQDYLYQLHRRAAVKKDLRSCGRETKHAD